MSDDIIPPSAKPKGTRDDALVVLKRLRDAGHVAYFAGGCVRDMLLGIEPKDYDVATDAPPEKVRRLFSNTQAVGAAFGVILVRLGGSQIEVATFRADLDYKDGRHPEGVRFTTAEEDAKRRDFTINGLFYNPIENKVIDHVGGQEDLKNRILRAIGEPNHRFEEDHLRMLRAVRFAARFGLTIDTKTREAIAAHAQHLKRISPERIADELRLMLTPTTRKAAFQDLWRLKLLHVIFRALPEDALAVPPDWDNQTRALFPQVNPNEPISFGLALAALSLCYRTSASERTLLAYLDRDEILRTLGACRTLLKISNEESDRMESVLYLAPLLQDDPPSIAMMKRFLARAYSSDARCLLDALLASNSSLTRVVWLREQLSKLEKEEFAPPPLVTGDDLVAQGLKPGRLFKRVLDDVYDAQLEHRVKTKEEAMRLALEIART